MTNNDDLDANALRRLFSPFALVHGSQGRWNRLSWFRTNTTEGDTYSRWRRSAGDKL
jgi:hypothetical protein